MHVGGSSLESAVLTCYSMHIIACNPDLVNPCISRYHLIKVLTRKGYFLDPICNCFHRWYKMRAFWKIPTSHATVAYLSQSLKMIRDLSSTKSRHWCAICGTHLWRDQDFLMNELITWFFPSEALATQFTGFKVVSQASLLPHWGKGLVNWVVDCSPGTLDTVAQSEDSISHVIRCRLQHPFND